MLVKNKKINLCFFLFSGTIVSLSPLYLMACGDNGKPFQNLTVGNNFSIHSKTEAEYLMYRTNICLEIFSQDEISFDFSTITQNAVETKINKLVINGDDSLLTYDLASFIY
jgi:hypothetical protein